MAVERADRRLRRVAAALGAAGIPAAVAVAVRWPRGRRVPRPMPPVRPRTSMSSRTA